MTVTSSRTVYPPQPWREHLVTRRNGPDRWDQGDHILVCGPTKAGKTTMAATLVQLRSHVVIFVSKTEDATFAREYLSRGWVIYREWPKHGPRPWETRILLWPREVAGDMDATVAHQRVVYKHALNAIYRKGRWCVVIDEALMFCDPKQHGLSKNLEHLHYWGRSKGISMVTLSQRIAWLPRIVRSSVTHAYIAKTVDSDDVKSLSDFGGVDKKVAALNLAALPSRHDYVYFNPQGDASPVIVNTRR